MLYAIDIDGTIANPEPTLMAYHNQEFALGLTTEELHCTYAQFLRLPQVQGIPREALEQSRQRARVTPEFLLSYDEIDHAGMGVGLLAEQGEIMYYTVRAACVEEATRTWLQKHGFPCLHNVILCRSVLHKLVQLHLHERETHHTIVLIDDRYQQMIKDVARLAAGEFLHLSEWQEIVQFVQQRLLLVAFGALSLPASTCGLHVLPMQSWRHVTEGDQVSLFLKFPSFEKGDSSW